MENQLLVRRLADRTTLPFGRQCINSLINVTPQRVMKCGLSNTTPCLLKDKPAKLSTSSILEIFLLYKVIGVGKSPTRTGAISRLFSD